nr:hypothetical protein [Tanacetum cinerariifolium]
MENKEENHALVADEEAPTEFALMAKTSAESEVFDNSLCSKTCKKNTDSLNSKITELTNKLSDSENMLYHYKLGLFEFVDDTVTDYSRPSPAIESTSDDLQNRNPFVTETGASLSNIISKPFIKFVKETNSPTENKTDKVETVKKPAVKYAELYRKPSKKSNVKGVKKGRTCPTNTHKSIPSRPAIHKSHRPQMRPIRPNMNGGCKITGKRTIKTGKIEFENVYFIKDLKDFKLIDDTNVLLRTPRQHNMYSIDLNNIVPHKDLTCLVAKASADESMLWHRRLEVSEESFKQAGGTGELAVGMGDFTVSVSMCSAEGLNVEAVELSKAFRVFNKRTRRVEENLHVEFLENKAIEQEFLENKAIEQGVGPNWLFDIDSLTKSMNYVLVDAGTISTNLSGTKDTADQEVRKNESSPRYILLPNWAHDALLESTSSKSYEESSSQVPEGSGNPNSTASTFNPSAEHMETLTVESPIPTTSSPVPPACLNDSSETSNFLENKAIEKGTGPNWLFDIDSLTNSMNYVPVVHDALLESSSSNAQDTCKADTPESSGNPNPTATTTSPLHDKMETLTVETLIPTVSSPALTVYFEDSLEPSSTTRIILKRVTSQDVTPSLDNIYTFSNRFDDILGVTTSIVDLHGEENDIIGPMDTPIQTRHKSKEMKEQSFIATIHQMPTPNLLQFCLFSCFLSQEEPKKIFDALKDPNWVEAMQEELLQFKIQHVWTLVDCPEGVRPIGTKWVLKNKKDESGIVIRNKA